MPTMKVAFNFKADLIDELVEHGITREVATEIKRIAYALDYRQFKFVAFSKDKHYTGSPDLFNFPNQDIVLENVKLQKCYDENHIPASWPAPEYHLYYAVL
jgi:hypothetical protein